MYSTNASNATRSNLEDVRPGHLVARVSSILREDEFEGTTTIGIMPATEEPRSRRRRRSAVARGYFAHKVFVGEILRLEGLWESTDDGRPIFSIENMTREAPSSRAGEVALLWKMFRIKKSEADRILEEVGGLEEFSRICQKDPGRLEELIPNSPRIRAQLMLADWDRTEMDLSIWRALLGAGAAAPGKRGISATQIRNLIRRYGTKTLKKILAENPYETTDVQGIGFKTADMIARYYSTEEGRPFDPLMKERLKVGIGQVLGDHCMATGDSHLDPDTLLRTVIRRLRSPDGSGLPDSPEARQRIASALEEAIRGRILIRDHGMIYTRGLFRAESDIALYLSKLARIGGSKSSDARAVRILERIEKEDGIRLSEEQTKGILTMLKEPVSILTGGPGTGKTLTVGRLVRVLREMGEDFMILAPTGKAASRASSQADAPAYTIHRACMLEIDADVNAREFGQKLRGIDFFRANHIIVDESSMPDLRSYWEVLRRVKVGKSRITFVGDPKQLPSVGPGQVMKDMLESRSLPVVELTTVRRTEGDGGALDYFYDVRDGRVPQNHPDEWTIRHIEPEASPSWQGNLTHRDAAALEAHLFRRWIPLTIERYRDEMGLDPVRDIQVLAPQHKGPCGVQALNEVIRDTLNPLPPTLVQKRGHVIRIKDGYIVQRGDKVMETSNNYYLRFTDEAPAEAYEEFRSNLLALQVKRKKKNPRKSRNMRTVTEVDRDVVPVSNGQVGIVESVDPQEGRLVIRFEGLDFPVLYKSASEWNSVAPAWAMSVHKSQGSEARVPFLVFPRDAVNLSNALFYTGITRMKEAAAIFASRATREKAIKHTDAATRRSLLAKRIRDHLGLEGPD